MTSVVEVLVNNSVVEVIPVPEVDVVEVINPGPQGPRGPNSIVPLDDRPSTLNEVINGGVTLGFWP